MAALQAARAHGSKGPFCTIAYPNFKYNLNQSRKELWFADNPHMVLHILRHTCASRLVQAGIDLRRVQTFLGHQTIQMTLRYAHLATNDLDQCVLALDAVNGAAVSPPPAPVAAPSVVRTVSPKTPSKIVEKPAYLPEAAVVSGLN